VSLTPAADLIPGNSETHILPLIAGRQLSYAHNGHASSRKVALFFTGVFGVAKADTLLAAVESERIHYIAVTPPGWGASSPRPAGVEYAANLIESITALLDALHPAGVDALYVAGGSFGTVPAQMLYGNDGWKYAPALAGCMLLAGFSPFRYHAGYAACLSWPNWLSVGAPALLPAHALQRLMRAVLARKFASVSGTKGFLESTLFAHPDADEDALMAAWLAKHHRTRDQFISDMAAGVHASVARTWDGFMEVADVIHSDWGFDPATLKNTPVVPVLVVTGEQDAIGGAMNAWIVKTYPHATARTTKGGHIGALFVMDELWSEFLGMCKRARE
jgi:hypothetical protein